MYRYKLYIAVMYTVVIQTSFKLKEILIIWLEERKKWSEKPKGKTPATFLTLS